MLITGPFDVNESRPRGPRRRMWSWLVRGSRSASVPATALFSGSVLGPVLARSRRGPLLGLRVPDRRDDVDDVVASACLANPAAGTCQRGCAQISRRRVRDARGRSWRLRRSSGTSRSLDQPLWGANYPFDREGALDHGRGEESVACSWTIALTQEVADVLAASKERFTGHRQLEAGDGGVRRFSHHRREGAHTQDE